MTKYKISLFRVRSEYREIICGLGIHRASSIREAVSLLDADPLIRETRVLFTIDNELFLGMWTPVDILGRPVLLLLEGSQAKVLQRALVSSSYSLERLLREESGSMGVRWEQQEAEG